MAVSRVKVSSCVFVCAVSFLVVIESCSAGCGCDGNFQCSARTKREADNDRRPKIPLFLAEQLNEADSFEEILNILDPTNVEPPVIAQEVISRKSSPERSESPTEPSSSPTTAAISARIGVNTNDVTIEARASKPKEKKILPAKCRPMNVTVPIKQPDDPNVYYFPQCVFLEQCTGCCFSSEQQCEPVAAYKVGRRNTDPANRLTTIVAMERHTMCKCNCKIKPQHCNSLQTHQGCDCVCTNTDEKNKCLSNPKKIWDKEKCTCNCREIEDCTTGLEFDETTCTCIRRSQSLSINGAPGTRYESRADDRRRRRWGNTTKYTVVPSS